MVEIWDGEYLLHLVMTEAPYDVVKDWEKDRMLFYRKLEGSAELRDEPPRTINGKAPPRMKLPPAQCDEIWKAILAPGVESYSHVDLLMGAVVQ